MSVLPNTFLGNTISAVPGSKTATTGKGAATLSGNFIKMYAQAMAAAATVANMKLGNVLSTTGHIDKVAISRSGITNSLALEVTLRVDDAYITTMHISHSRVAESLADLMVMCNVYNLDHLAGCEVEILYTNDAAEPFLNSNGSLVRALRNLDIAPELIVADKRYF